MATTTIPWGDGSGDNIYLTYSSASGDQTVEVSSDANTGSARTKTITFTAGNATETLTVNQSGVPQQYTVTFVPSSYDTTDYNWDRTSNLSSGYTDHNSTTYAIIYYKKGTGAETHVYFKFNTSSIPNNATIGSVSCIVKCRMQGNASISPTRTVQMFSGTTAKGSAQSLSSQNDTTFTFSDATWTREELNDIRIKLRCVRGSSQVDTGYSMRFYGATLTVTYTA